MDLGAGEIAGLAAAGLAAGAINAAAGGGTLISFPALVAVGYAPLTANVTNTVALCPGYAGGAYSYRRELRGQRRRIVALAAVSVAGSIGGAALLGATSQHVFRVVAPVLVLFACLLLAAQPWIRRRLRAPAGRDRRSVLVAQLPASVYGAYFGAAVGVVMLAVLGALIEDTLQRLNALKALLALVINWVAAAWFIGFEPVRWEAVAIIAPTSLIGGRLGVLAARRLSDRALRLSVLAFGIAAAAYLATNA